MKKFKDSLHIFSPKNKRCNDNKKNETKIGIIYEIGNEIEETFDEDVENIKFNADDISSFFIKNNELDNKKESVTFDIKDATKKDILKETEENKIEMLFDTTTCGPYICCVVILSKGENVDIEFIYPYININEENLMEKKNIKITPFNVWFRYKGEWIKDVKELLLERMDLFKESSASNILCDFNNYKSHNHEYNILYSISGNKYYLISLDYLEDNKCKQIMVISQIPYFNILSMKLYFLMQSFIKKKDYKIIEQFTDTFSSDRIFREITFNDIYLNLSKDIEHVHNIKIKNILIFLKSILLEKKVILVCSNKGIGCKMLLLFLSFIPDIINFGFNIRNYEEKFEEWIKLKLPLILFHDKYPLFLHIDNLKLFNKYTSHKNYLLSTNINSDVYNFIKNDVDVLYDIDKDTLIIKNENLINPLKLTKFENNYLKKIHSISKSFFNLSLFFENMMQNEKTKNMQNINYSNVKIHNIVNNFNIKNDRAFVYNYGDNSNNNNNINDNSNFSNNNSNNDNNISNGDINNDNKSNNDINNDNNISNNKINDSGNDDDNNNINNNSNVKNYNIDNNNVLYKIEETYMKNEELTNKNDINEREIDKEMKKELNKNDVNDLQNNRINNNIPKNEHMEEKYEYIDDEEDIYIINTRLATPKKNTNCIEISENITNNNDNNNNAPSFKNNEVEKYIIDLRKHFYAYFNDFFLLSKENFEEGLKEKRDIYELNYNKLFIEFWQKETKNYNFFIEKDSKINKFLKIAEQNNVLLDKNDIADYKFMDDILIIQKKDKSETEINKNLKQVLLISLNGYIYEGSYCISKNCKEGLGKFVYNAYDITFQGEWKNDKINGSGHLYTKEFKYFGKFKNNLFNGNGIFVDNLLNQYEGEFLNGYFNGNGKLIFNKNTYIGIFENNNLIGKGNILYKNGSIYTGEIKNFLPHGYGFLSYDDSTIFEGFFIEGKKNGNGFLTLNSNSTSTETFCIEGKWKNDEPVIKKNFNIIFPNRDKYIGKIYILSNLKNTNKKNNILDDMIVTEINKELFNVREFIENRIGFIIQEENNNKNIFHLNSVIKKMNDISDAPINQCNSNISCLKSNSTYLEDKNFKKSSSLINEQGSNLMEANDSKNNDDDDINNNSENIRIHKKRILKEKLETIVVKREKTLLKKSFKALNKYWIYNIENKLKKNKDVIEYLQQKKLFIIPHNKGLSIYNKKKENYDGKFCLGMKHGYGISFYGDINRYEGYWFRGMKHGYGILYEGDSIFYAHFNYDKLVEKEEILPEKINNYKPKKEDSNVKIYDNFLINQSFFDYKSFISSSLYYYF